MSTKPIPIPTDTVAQLLSYRGFYGSEDHLPDEKLLNGLSAESPYWFPIYDSLVQLGGGLGPQQTDRGQLEAHEDCWLLSLMSSSAQAAGFTFQLFDTEREIGFMDQDIQNTLQFGTALRPFYLKTPFYLPVGGQLESRIINLATVSNTIQIVGHGIRPNFRKKIT